MPRQIATTTTVDRDALLDFVRPRHSRVLMTARSAGRPQAAPVTGGVDYYRAISGEHPDWDEYRQAMRDQGKSLLRITPTRWGPVARGGFPPRMAD